jgi:hypothetical protein
MGRKRRTGYGGACKPSGVSSVRMLTRSVVEQSDAFQGFEVTVTVQELKAWYG